ncbi:MAG: helix-turn-helix domain-containing protein [Deltaproteobacteria bacterium]|jgi:predicted site-specific integrase-resolvase|nr:helix-turn-helix domain-containing protein [Deltaproteobacteria bacterium]
MEKKFLTIKELAERWRIDINVAYRLQSEGKLPPAFNPSGLKKGKKLYPMEDVIKWESNVKSGL